MKIKTNITAALIAALAIFFAARFAPARAQDASAAYVVSYIEVAPSARTTAVYLLRALRDISRKEAGNTGFVVLQRIGQPQFAILESWSDAKAQAAHAAAAAAAQFRDKLKPYLAAPVDERTSTGFAVGQPKPSTASAVYAVTHVDLIGAKKTRASPRSSN
jgi:quinol monooxygenase YgiN